MERDSIVNFFVDGVNDFNSHAHVERDLQDAQNAGYKPCISTHTLTWSVT